MNEAPRLDRVVLVVAALLAALAVFIMSGCADDKTGLGTARHASVEAQASAQVKHDLADAAEVDAATKEAQAAELKALAEQMPTEARIAAAADARVLAASARAVAVALSAAADKATARAREAAKLAETERQAQERADSDAWWLWWCRAIALGGLVVGAVIGGLIAYATHDPRTGGMVGASVAGLGLLVLGFGQSMHWIAILPAVAIVLGLVIWAVKHRRLLGDHWELEGAHAVVAESRDLLAKGYVRTANALEKVAPGMCADLDEQNMREHRDAGTAVKASSDVVLFSAWNAHKAGEAT